MAFEGDKKLRKKLLIKFTKKKKGSVAILLTLLFISIAIAFFAIVEGAGRMALKSTAEASYDLAGRSILSMYDRDLLERYRLFAFQADNNVLKEYLEIFANSTIESKDMSGGKSRIRSFETSAYSITNPDNFMAELNGLMGKVIVENILSSAASNFKDFEEQINEKEEVENSTEQMLNDLEEAQKKEYEEKDSESSEGDENEDSEGEEEEDSEGMSLFDVVRAQAEIRNIISRYTDYEPESKDTAVLKNSAIIDDLPSAEAGCKRNTAFSGVGNIISKFSNGISPETIKEDVYINEYIMKFFENHLKEHDEEKSLFHNEVEYILYGSYSDADNYKKAHRSIFMIKTASNMVYLLTNPEKRAEIMATAEVLTPGPWAKLTYLLIITAWSSVEAANDMKNLEMKNSVPIIKTDKTWKTNWDGIIEGLMEGVIELDEGHMDYDNYLRILLMTEEKNTKLYRIMDLIQINMKGSFRSDFLMEDHCVGFSFKADVSKKNFSNGFIKNKGDFTVDMSHTYVNLIEGNYYDKSDKNF